MKQKRRYNSSNVLRFSYLNGGYLQTLFNHSCGVHHYSNTGPSIRVDCHKECFIALRFTGPFSTLGLVRFVGVFTLVSQIHSF